MTDSAIASTLPTPKLFVSYSWSSPEHEAWVLSLAEQLTEQGIEVLLDKWDLRTGHDAHAFMEQMVSDPAVNKVILICDKKYSEKSDSRTGGAGTEAQIITPEIYTKKTQDKYAAIVTERDEEGRPYLPVYYKGRIFIDLSDDSIYAEGFEQLVRWAWDKPLNIKPSVGKPPSFVMEDYKSVKMATTAPFRRALEAIRQKRIAAVPVTIDYLSIFASELNNFRIAATHENAETFDDEIVKSIEAFMPYRNELVDLFLTAARYDCSEEMVEALHRFFEQLMSFFEVPEGVASSFETDTDNLKFIIHELFLCCIGAFIKYEKFDRAAYFIENDYYHSSRFSNENMYSFRFFREHLKSFDDRNKRLGLRRRSLRAEFLKQRASASGLDFKFMMTGDFVLYLRSHQESIARYWWPETLVYATFYPGLKSEVFARAKSAKYFERIKPLLGVQNKAALEAMIAQIESAAHGRIPRWEYESIDPRRMLRLDEMATVP